MFDKSEKLVSEQDEIFGLSPINWEGSPLRQSALVNDEEVISLSHAKVFVFSDSVLCLGKVNQNPSIKCCLERTVDLVHHSTELWDTMQLANEIQKFMNKMGDQAQFQGRIILMSMFNDIIWRSTGNERECIANATPVTLFAKRFPAGTSIIPRIRIRKEVVFYLN